MLGLVSKDLRSPLDIREVIMRIVDESKFEEFKAPLRTNASFAAGHQYMAIPWGLVGNNGALFSESAEKGVLSLFNCATQIDVPLDLSA